MSARINLPTDNAVWLSDFSNGLSRQIVHVDSTTGPIDVPAFVHPTWGVQLVSKGMKNRVATSIAKLAATAGYRADQRRCQDAAGNFVTSTLTKILAPAEDVTRGDKRPWLFVPGRVPADQLALISRDIMEPGYRDYEYRVREMVGQAKWGDPNRPRSFNNADTVEDIQKGQAHWYGINFEVTLTDLWTDAITDRNARGDKEASAMLALDDMRERVSGFGDPEKKLSGLARVSSSIIVAGGGRLTGAGLTAEQLVQRVTSWIELYAKANNNMMPVACMAPREDLVLLQTTIFTGTDKSAWDKLVITHPWLATSHWDYRMSTASPDGTPRWTFYARDDMSLFVAHTETMLFGPFEDMTSMRFLAIRRHGGVVAKKPEQVVNIDFT
jgi:hypothetical protein